MNIQMADQTSIKSDRVREREANGETHQMQLKSPQIHVAMGPHMHTVRYRCITN